MTRGKKHKSRSVLLADMRDRLQAIQHYDNPEKAFDWLLYGYMKHTGRSTAWKCQVVKRGCMSYSFAKDFANYCGYPIHLRPKIYN